MHGRLVASAPRIKYTSVDRSFGQSRAARCLVVSWDRRAASVVAAAAATMPAGTVGHSDALRR